jgi:hypothetical protein
VDEHAPLQPVTCNPKALLLKAMEPFCSVAGSQGRMLYCGPRSVVLPFAASCRRPEKGT